MRWCYQAGTMDKSNQTIAQIAGREPGLWAKAWEHHVSGTKANTTLGCTNKGMACKVQAQALFLYPAVRLVLGYGSPRMRAGHRGSHVADRRPGEQHLWGKSKGTALVLPEEGKKGISTCGAAKWKAIVLLSACGAARQFRVSHWEIIIAGQGSGAEDRQQPGVEPLSLHI